MQNINGSGVCRYKYLLMNNITLKINLHAFCIMFIRITQHNYGKLSFYKKSILCVTICVNYRKIFLNNGS